MKDDTKSTKPIQLPNPDEDPANRDWIRTLAKRRRRGDETPPPPTKKS